MWRHCGCPRVHVYKYKARPELAVLQQVQGMVSYRVLIGQSHKFIQNHTLEQELDRVLEQSQIYVQMQKELQFHLSY